MSKLKVIAWYLMFPVMFLIVNPLNDLTGAIRDWWESDER